MLKTIIYEKNDNDIKKSSSYPLSTFLLQFPFETKVINSNELQKDLEPNFYRWFTKVDKFYTKSGLNDFVKVSLKFYNFP